jgi:hypothetical protein
MNYLNPEIFWFVIFVILRVPDYIEIQKATGGTEAWSTALKRALDT